MDKEDAEGGRGGVDELKFAGVSGRVLPPEVLGTHAPMHSSMHASAATPSDPGVSPRLLPTVMTRFTKHHFIEGRS